MEKLLIGLAVLPLSAGIWAATFGRRPSRYLALVAAGLTALLALILLPTAGRGPSPAVQWLPGTGPMALGSGATSLYAALATALSGFLVLLGTVSRRGPRSARADAVSLLTLAAAGVAFLADHFLLRYVALEIVALGVALAPMIELSPPEGPRLSRFVYLVLRLGDAGMLAAILILWSASGTLDIASSLETGQALDATRLGWVAAGFALAVWVKLGGWPLHLWIRVGRWLAPGSHVWLYATVLPNLGLYLLYRVTPLLALAPVVRQAALWIGAGGAVLAAFIALTQVDPHAAFVYLGAAQGGLALFLAATGAKSAVWLSLLVATPLRLLLFLAADALSEANSPARRKVAAGSLALGMLALAAYGLLTTWWAYDRGAPLDTLFLAQVAVALLGVWAVSAAWQFVRGPSDSAVQSRSRVEPGSGSEERSGVEASAGLFPPQAGVSWSQWLVLGVLGVGVLAGTLSFGPLVRWLSATSHAKLPAVPASLALLRYAATTPAFWIVGLLSLAVWRLWWKPGIELLDMEFDLEESLARAAQIVRAAVEVGIQEQILALIVQGVMGGASLTQRIVERQILEGSMYGLARAAMEGGRVTYRVLEQGSLEGLLRQIVRGVLSAGRAARRWHTGRLRRNLLWVTICLLLAVLSLVFYSW